MKNFILFLAVALSSSFLAACGSDGGGSGADGGAGSPCGFSENYLPFEEGYSWTYRLTNLGTPEVATKTQALTLETDPDLGEVLVQTTSKNNGSTVSFFKVQDGVVLRLVQRDLDATGALERTTTYDPGQLRLDESSERLLSGAQWDSTYEAVVTDGTGVEVSRVATTDHWEVLAVNADCSSPLGSFACLHLRRQRTAGGVSDKEYFFAKGVGKVKEINANQLEELVSCQ